MGRGLLEGRAGAEPRRLPPPSVLSSRLGTGSSTPLNNGGTGQGWPWGPCGADTTVPSHLPVPGGNRVPVPIPQGARLGLAGPAPVLMDCAEFVFQPRLFQRKGKTSLCPWI